MTGLRAGRRRWLPEGVLVSCCVPLESPWHAYENMHFWFCMSLPMFTAA